MIEEFESTPEGAQEMAAARLALSVRVLLRAAFEGSGANAAQLATTLGVSESAVSQVLNGDGNVRISTLGRYLRGLGYQPFVEACPAVDGVAPIHCELPFLQHHARDAYSRVISDTAGGTWHTSSNVVRATPGRMVIETVATHRRASAPLVVVDQDWSALGEFAIPAAPNVHSVSRSG